MMGCLIVAGETIYSLPFHVARFFRPTFLLAFDFTNSQLGAVQATYGVIAMLAYFPGGPLADRFSARKLLAASLWTTSVGGLYFATIPGYRGVMLLFGFWGVTTILLFWAALIRACRDWGDADEQGRAYGILDAGRGLVAAGLASLLVVAFHHLFPADPRSATPEQRLAAIRGIILLYSFVTAGAGVLVWFFVADQPLHQREPRPKDHLAAHIGTVLRLPAVWLQALIVVCAYVGYKGLDNYSLYAVVGYGMDEVAAAQVVAMGAWLRPIAALGAGLLGDRIHSSRIVIGAFAILLLADVFLALNTPLPAATWVLSSNVAVSCAAVFGLRGVYFALLEEGRVPMLVTGTAVGLVSVIGYTPDIFVGLVGGWLLDRTPGLGGHQHFYTFLAAFAAMGLIVSVIFERCVSHPRASSAAS